ncbi:MULTISPECIES: hypothetical protein [unclassified Bradyrhizobium]|uniref:hypothetical protein n=1 Tax=unclassified Bradyrhizobium TaxID=2631580 RepID=UPI00247AD64A|nr:MULTISPECIES: hypothetical protein [unclassified Bradyrhizobium]WGS22716.1 hypothetical protein MTX22_14245 [Bradyrhizobium sp. ISRA463]WGS29705.1 hypothetical protein MTX19_12015 [Bradyrhizobium sp. ISRA464]
MKLKLAVMGLAALGCAVLVSGSASAMPNGLPQAKLITGQAANVNQVRWVCGPRGHCWWRPNYYGAYAYGGPRPGWRWRHPGWRWRHPGWRWGY